MMDEIQYLVNNLNLEPHPEGGFYRETYRSEGIITMSSEDNRYSGERNFSTCIYFLLTSDNFSAFHKIKQDEIWHFYSGSPISLHIIDEQGVYTKHTIGSNFEAGEVPQFVVKGGDWFASEVELPNSYCLAGCTVAPGFDFSDFVMAQRDQLCVLYPQHSKVIERLTRDT